MARKYFGQENPLGKILRIDPKQRDQNGKFTGEAIDYTVTGVMNDIPRRSHFPADFLLSFVDLNDIYGGDITTGSNLNPGFWRWRFAHTYLLLKGGADPAALEAKLPDFLERNVHEASKARGFYYKSFLQAIPEIYLGGNFGGQLAPVGDKNNLYLFSLTAFFVLLIGCINFMNLCTARAADRAKEVGIRKVVGAYRGQLVKQFLGESILLTTVALLLALGLAEIIQPRFYEYIGKNFIRETADVAPLIAGIVVIGIFVSIVAGSYPAFFLSRFKPVAMLGGKWSGKSRGQWLRKGLVVLQFGVSAVLIVATVTVFRQLSFMQNYRLGFDQEQVVVLPPTIGRSLMGGYEAFKSELKKYPGVAEVTAASGLPGFDTGGDLYAEEGVPGEEAIVLSEYSVDYNFIDMLGLELIAGRNFSREMKTDAGVRDESGRLRELALIVNEETVNKFGWSSSEAALGKRIVRDPKAVDYTGTVIGVVRDFHFQSLRESISPLALSVLPSYNFVAVKVRAEKLSETIAFIRQTTERLAPEAPFEVSFLDENFAALYQAEQKMGEVFGYISALAILIACMGLFGLASFAVEHRTKEIGVRKVLGASVSGIVAMLSKDFVKLVLVANLVAWPVAYFAINKWLEHFAYRSPDLAGAGGWWIFALAGGLALAIAMIAVSTQAIKAALANPVEALRYE
jgi:putative ABC transport system permease protein